MSTRTCPDIFGLLRSGAFLLLPYLRGAAAQTWQFHRKPEAMANAPRCSPHVITWRRVVAQGVRRVTADFSHSPPEFAPTHIKAAALAGSRVNSAAISAAAAAAMVGDFAGAEAAGLYLRLSPSRAWRDRFAWDCRTVACVLCALEEATSHRGTGEGGRRRAVMARALVTRAALLSCPAEALQALLPAVAAAVGRKQSAAAVDQNASVGGRVAVGDAPPEPSVGHPWGPGHSPEQLWAPLVHDVGSCCDTHAGGGGESVDSAGGGGGGGYGSEGDPWAWLPAAARRGLFDAAWPCAKRDTERFAAVEAAWVGTEAVMVASALPEEVLAALWRRSEMAANDVTPLGEEEEVARAALREAVQAYQNK